MIDSQTRSGVLLVALLWSTCCQAQPTPPPTRSDDGKIAFMSDRDGNQEIYTINPDGTGLTRLTNNQAKDGFPAWAPDQRSIAFVSDRDGEDQLYLCDADGANVRKLTDIPGRKQTPCWSPEGSRLAFSAANGESVIHILDRPSGETTELCQGDSPSWSPDGSTIVFIGGNLAGLGVIDAGGGQQRPFLQGAPSAILAFNHSPKWSPDGTFVVFSHLEAASKRESSADLTYDLYALNQEGREPRRLTHSGAPKTPYGFSPDGKSILYGSAETGTDVELYIMNIDGSGVRRLTDSKGSNSSASWSASFNRKN